MKKVLFVCLGNICRSPMAEGVFNRLIKERGLEGSISCDSAGTAGYHIGELPDFRTRKVCELNNTPLNHRGRKISKEDIQEFDLLLAMDQANYYDILHQLSIKELDQKKVRLMRSYELGAENGEVPDPYYGDMQDFHNVFAMLEKACRGLLEELIPAIETEH
jgi:protein-tyrosine phosphatase